MNNYKQLQEIRRVCINAMVRVTLALALAALTGCIPPCAKPSPATDIPGLERFEREAADLPPRVHRVPAEGHEADLQRLAVEL